MRADAAGPPTSAPDTVALAAFGLGTLFAGANAVAVRFTVAELPPFWGAGLRFAAAALIFWAIAGARRIPLPEGRVLPGLVLYGLVGFGAAFGFGYWGLQTVPAGLAQVLLALTPLLTFFFAYLHGLESFRWRGLAGAVIATAGIAWSFLERPEGIVSIVPLLAVVAAAACIAESIVILKQLPAFEPVMTNAVGMTSGAMGLLLLSAVSGETWKLPSLMETWLSVVYLVLIGSVGVFYLFVVVIRRWTASAASYQLVLMPFVTVAIGAWLAGERVNAGMIVGGALVLVGVWVGALAQAARLAAQVQPAPVTGEAD